MASIDRALATVRKIVDIQQIPGADAIEVARVDGWKVVVKKNEFQAGDLVIYFEIDSWVPHEIAPFLSKGKEPKVYNGVPGNRLKTVRLRGQLSQGLILPITTEILIKIEASFQNTYESYIDEGLNLTEILGIQKWEPPVNPQLAGITKGNFPPEIPRTDQPRIQNLSKQFARIMKEDDSWEVSEKLDGTSVTFYLKRDGEFIVCSRNINLKEDENNLYWKVARQYNIEKILKEVFEIEDYNGERQYIPIALQGEIIGEGIQGNQYGIKGQEFYVFDIYDPLESVYVEPIVRRALVTVLGLKHVPTFGYVGGSSLNSTDDLIITAKGKSVLNDSTREGIVLKRHNQLDIRGVTSFKVINDDWLEEKGK